MDFMLIISGKPRLMDSRIFLPAVMEMRLTPVVV